MEIFDASGVGQTDSRADALAQALASLAAPLERTAAATEGMIPLLQDIAGSFGDSTVVGAGDTTATEGGSDQLERIAKATESLVPLTKLMSYHTELIAMHQGLPTGQPGANKGAASVPTVPLAQTGQATGKGIGVPTGGAGGAGGALGSASSALGAIGSAAGAAAGALAAVAGAGLAVVGALGGLVLVASKFTELIDPAAVEALNLAFRDLGAIFGTVLSPIVTEATQFLRGFAASLHPIVDSALPAMRIVADAVNDVLMSFLPIVSSLASAFASAAPLVAELARAYADYLIPQIQGFTVIFSGLVGVFKAGMQGIMAALNAVFGGNLRATAANFGQSIARVTVIVSALAFKLFGLNMALDAMITDLQGGGKGLAGQRDATGLANAQNAKYTGIAELGRDVAAKAFASSGRVGPADAEVDDQTFRKTLLADIKAIQKMDWKQKLIEAIAEGVGKAILSERKVMQGLGVAANPVIGNAAGLAARIGRNII